MTLFIYLSKAKILLKTHTHSIYEGERGIELMPKLGKKPPTLTTVNLQRA